MKTPTASNGSASRNILGRAFRSLRPACLGAALLLCANATLAQTSGTATLTASGAGPYQYSLTLSDSSASNNIGTFWFSWVPGEGFLMTSPSNLLSPPGWTATITDGPGGTNTNGNGFSIQWTATSNAVTPGITLSGFGFESTDTPAQIAGNSLYYTNPPVGTSTLYIGTPLTDPGFQLVVQPISSFFNGQVSVGGNFLYLGFFGYYTVNVYPYVYHDGLGFLYAIDAADVASGIYFYDFNGLGFFYTTPALFPYVYDFQVNAWLYYFKGSQPATFYNFGAGQFITQ